MAKASTKKSDATIFLFSFLFYFVYCSTSKQVVSKCYLPKQTNKSNFALDVWNVNLAVYSSRTLLFVPRNSPKRPGPLLADKGRPIAEVYHTGGHAAPVAAAVLGDRPIGLVRQQRSATKIALKARALELVLVEVGQLR